MPKLKPFLLDVLLFLLASPVIVVQMLRRGGKKARFFALPYSAIRRFSLKRLPPPKGGHFKCV